MLSSSWALDNPILGFILILLPCIGGFMKCPKCQFENPDTMKFCGECGGKLEKLCPKCNAANPLQFKFCGECGQAVGVLPKATLQELSFDGKLAKIQKYLPGGLTEKILA